MDKKKCPGCGEWFERTAENFARNARAKDGLRARCKSCVKVWTKRHYQKIRTAFIEQQKAYYREHREERIAYQKAYYQRNREEILARRVSPEGRQKKRERDRRYYQKHREKILERQRAYDRALAQRRKASGQSKNN